MIRPGLTSITFRQLSADEVIHWAAEAQLEGIEWGGDIHVPHGQVEQARQVAARTRDAGLAVSSYGSYYRVGHDDPDPFAGVLETAVALDAPILRVWAGRLASDKADAAYRAGVAGDGRRIAELAREAGIRIACEWHGNTLTDTPESARALFEAVDHANFRTYWQPPKRLSPEQCMADLDAAMPRLIGLHVFFWDAETVEKRPLSEGRSAWQQFLARAATAGDMFALLEFVIDADPNRWSATRRPCGVGWRSWRSVAGLLSVTALPRRRLTQHDIL